jgi:SHS2 domain-containing protein
VGRSSWFEHTADVGLRIEAESLDDLFQTAAEALFDDIVANRHEIRPLQEQAVTLESDSPAALFLDWLNELIYRGETTHQVFAACEVAVNAQGTRLQATLRGEPIDPERHVLGHEIKAATLHDLALVEQADGRWHAEVILDI